MEGDRDTGATESDGTTDRERETRKRHIGRQSEINRARVIESKSEREEKVNLNTITAM